MEKKSAIRDIKRWLPGVLISIVAVILIFQFANWDDLGNAFAAIKPQYLLIGIPVIVIWLIVRAMGLWTLLEKKAKIKDTFWAINIGYLLNNLFPLRAGEFGRAILLGKSSGLGFFNILSVIVIERAFDLVFASIILLISLPIAIDDPRAMLIARLILVVVFLVLLIMYFIARNHEKAVSFFERLAGKNKLAEKYLLPNISKLLNGFKVLTNPFMFLQAMTWNAMSWLLAVVFYYVMLLSIEPSAPFWWAMLADSVLAMGIAIPSAPAAIGVFEAALVGALQMVNVTYEKALAYAIMMHFLQFAITGILGFVGLAKENQSIQSLLSEIQTKKTD